MDPSYVDATMLLADQFAAQGELDKAIRVLRLSESQRPGLAGVADKLAQLEASATAQPATPTP
jgi:hypothetical protein